MLYFYLSLISVPLQRRWTLSPLHSPETSHWFFLVTFSSNYIHQGQCYYWVCISGMASTWRCALRAKYVIAAYPGASFKLANLATDTNVEIQVNRVFS